jgi:hypothetical protein
MDNLQIPDERLNDNMLKHSINDWLTKANRDSAVCTTVCHVYSGYKNVEGAFPVTRSQSRGVGMLIEREREVREDVAGGRGRDEGRWPQWIPLLRLWRGYGRPRSTSST